MKKRYYYIALTLVGCIFLLTTIFSNAIIHSIDFLPLYYASGVMNHGGNIYDFDNLQRIIKGDGHNTPATHYLYPPLLTGLFAPISDFTLYTSVLLWLVVNVIALIIAVGILIRNILPQKAVIYITSLILLLLLYPVWQNLYLGQINLLVLFFVVLGFFYFIKKKEVGSGIFFGIAVLLKVFPLVFLGYALLLKKCKITVIGGLTIIAGMLWSAMMYGSNGLESWGIYIFNILPKILTGSLEGWLPGNPFAGNLDVLWISPYYALVMSVFSKILLVTFFIYIIYKYLISKQKIIDSNLWLEFSYLCTLMIISSAFSFHHYLIWLIIPLVVLFKKYLLNKNKLLLTILVTIFIFAAWPPTFTESLLPTNINQIILPLINPGFLAVLLTLGSLIWQYFYQKTKIRVS